MKEIKDREKLKLFLDEYVKLCEKHNMVISSCGCCESPWVVKIIDGKIADGSTCGEDINAYREWLEKWS